MDTDNDPVPLSEWTEDEARALIGRKVQIVTTDVVEVTRIEARGGYWIGVVEGPDGEPWYISKGEDEWKFVE